MTLNTIGIRNSISWRPHATLIATNTLGRPLLPKPALTSTTLTLTSLLIPQLRLIRHRHIMALGEAKRRMERIKRQHRRRHNRALEPDEVALRANKMATPALRQLRNTINRASEDTQRSKDEGGQKAAEPD